MVVKVVKDNACKDTLYTKVCSINFIIVDMLGFQGYHLLAIPIWPLVSLV